MLQSMLALLSDSTLVPHGFCLGWQPGVLWLQVISDSVIALAYFGIATAIAVFVHRRTDLARGWLFWMFASFILACGITHVFDVWTLWEPVYGAQGVAKAVTAAISITTAVLLWPMIPGLLAMPTPAELRRVSTRLTTALARQERTEEALRESEQRYELLVQSVTDYALFMLDGRGHVTNWNRGAERIKGYSADEIVGEHFSRFYTEEDRAAGRPKRALEIAETEGRFEEEAWRVRKDGTRLWASVVIEAIRDAQGRLLGYAKITRDITERRNAALVVEQSRAMLAQSQKMEAVGQLTGGVAHDFNNLLTAVLGSLDMIARRPPAAADAETARFLATARRAAERGAELTGRLLAFGRRQALSPQSIDANRLVGAFSELLRRTLGEGVVLETVLAGDLWPTHVDPNQLENALLNLGVNARDAMPNGGRLTIETSNVVIDARAAAGVPDLEPGEFVAITVTDSGTGMPEEVIARAFEPFFTTKPEGRGTGLGLSQVFGFIKQSGGHVTITSEPARGTAVRLYLPRHRAEAVPEPAVAVPGVERVGRGETVLVVEDDADVRGYTTEAIAELGFEVLAAGDAQAALGLLDANPSIVLLFTDIGLPGLNGRQLAEEARRRRPGLKILLTTGYARDEKVRAGLLDENISLIPKPFSISGLAGKLRAALRSEAAR